MKRTSKPTTKKKVTAKKKNNKTVIVTKPITNKSQKILMDQGLLPKRLTKKQLDNIVKTTNESTGGRPSKYDPLMCIQVLELMAEGKSKETACIELGISHFCMHNWCNKGTEEEPNKYFKPAFYTAIKVGEKMSKRWWEECGRLNIHNKDFNATLYMMNMQNRHGWTRKWEGKVEEEKTVNHNHNYTLLKTERTDEHAAEILSILKESGALEQAVEGDAETKVH